jgi:hypothetical protein
VPPCCSLYSIQLACVARAVDRDCCDFLHGLGCFFIFEVIFSGKNKNFVVTIEI